MSKDAHEDAFLRHAANEIDSPEVRNHLADLEQADQMDVPEILRAENRTTWRIVISVVMASVSFLGIQAMGDKGKNTIEENVKPRCSESSQQFAVQNNELLTTIAIRAKTKIINNTGTQLPDALVTSDTLGRNPEAFENDFSDSLKAQKAKNNITSIDIAVDCS